MRFGQCEKTIFMFMVGMFIFAILIWINQVVRFRQGEGIPFWYTLMMLMGLFIMFMSVLWLISKVRGCMVTPHMDDAAPEEVVDVRVTNDGKLFSVFAKKGTYGKAETINYGKNADYNDDGSFPLRTINGNSAILTFDLLNHSIEPRRSVVRQYQRRYINDGPDAYRIWKKKKSEGKTWKIKT